MFCLQNYKITDRYELSLIYEQPNIDKCIYPYHSLNSILIFGVVSCVFLNVVLIHPHKFHRNLYNQFCIQCWMFDLHFCAICDTIYVSATEK